MDFIVTAYYSQGTLYEQEVKRLLLSLKEFELPYFVKPVQRFKNWYEGVQYKPTFIQEMLRQFAPASIVYVDADAEFLQYPSLFHKLNAQPDVNIAAHILDHSHRARIRHDPELLSGTLFLKNNDVVAKIVEEWKQRCTDAGQLWDQKALWDIIKSKPFQVLPEEYCTIFDYMSDVENPIIRHYQASRRVKNGGDLPTYNVEKTEQGLRKPVLREKSSPRKVSRGGVVRYQRKWK